MTILMTMTRSMVHSLVAAAVKGHSTRLLNLCENDLKYNEEEFENECRLHASNEDLRHFHELSQKQSSSDDFITYYLNNSFYKIDGMKVADIVTAILFDREVLGKKMPDEEK